LDLTISADQDKYKLMIFTIESVTTKKEKIF